MLLFLGIATIARAACDPHPHEHYGLSDDRAQPLLGATCDVRAGDGGTATLTCEQRVYHLTWVRP